jgi:hypothetical protein
MNESQLERLIVALESIALTMSLRYQKDFPEPKEKKRAEITRTNDDRREHFSDKAGEKWFEETEARKPSKFQEKLDANRAVEANGKAGDTEGERAETPGSESR